jgi:hypothetical protein
VLLDLVVLLFWVGKLDLGEGFFATLGILTTTLVPFRSLPAQ